MIFVRTADNKNLVNLADVVEFSTFAAPAPRGSKPGTKSQISLSPEFARRAELMGFWGIKFYLRNQQKDEAYTLLDAMTLAMMMTEQEAATIGHDQMSRNGFRQALMEGLDEILRVSRASGESVTGAMVAERAISIWRQNQMAAVQGAKAK
ncbi:hypothetical protein A2G06_16775 (plasmid) [Geobacter anodireducens]|nr:hypothetical protein A2G06_16775 [Geobacter anodireducens]